MVDLLQFIKYKRIATNDSEEGHIKILLAKDLKLDNFACETILL